MIEGIVFPPYEPTPTDKIYRMLVDLKDEFVLPLKWDEKKKQDFIQIVKHFIDMDYGKPYNFFIEFSDDYLSIKKKLFLYNR